MCTVHVHVVTRLSTARLPGDIFLFDFTLLQII